VLRRQPAAATAKPGTPVRGRPSRGWLTVPVGVTVAYNAAWIAWHLPFLYDEAQRQPLVYAAEVISFAGGGILLWRQLIGSWPHTPAFAPLYRVMLVAGTMASAAVLGMTLAFGSAVVYPAYRTPLHLHPLSVISDQQAGGGILWLLSLPPLLIAGVALLIRWLNDEEAEAVASGLDRLAGPSPRPVWPSRPGLR
jgi:cytochrome c oxidase assembly factor CtaG